MVFDSEGKSYAYATNHTLTLSGGNIDISTKDHGNCTYLLVDQYQWEITSENLYTTNDYDSMFEKMLEGTQIPIIFGIKTDEGLKLVADGDIPNWMMNQTNYFRGNAIITSLVVNSNNGENATYSVTFSGCGKMELICDYADVTQDLLKNYNLRYDASTYEMEGWEFVNQSYNCEMFNYTFEDEQGNPIIDPEEVSYVVVTREKATDWKTWMDFVNNVLEADPDSCNWDEEYHYLTVDIDWFGELEEGSNKIRFQYQNNQKTDDLRGITRILEEALGASEYILGKNPMLELNSTYFQNAYYVVWRNNSTNKSVKQRIPITDQGYYKVSFNHYSEFENDASIERHYDTCRVLVYNADGSLNRTYNFTTSAEDASIKRGAQTTRLNDNDKSFTENNVTYYVPNWQNTNSVQAYFKLKNHPYLMESPDIYLQKGQEMVVLLGQTYGGTKTNCVYSFPKIEYKFKAN